MLLPFIVPKSFRIIAHRGASAYAPENTIAAFELAFRMGVTEIELDTQLSTDGQVVLCHDKVLDRYGHGAQVVERMRWDKLAALDMGSWFSPFFFKDEKMITLDHLFTRCPSEITFHVEIKGRAQKLPQAVYRIITEHGLSSRCIITSFSYESLVAMRDLDAGLRLGWLVDKIDPFVLVRAGEINAFQICPRADQFNKNDVARAHEIVPEVRAWGLAGKTTQVVKLIHNVIDSGGDGLTINWPDWLRHA